MSRKTKETLNLQCTLTNDELLKYSREMSEAISEKTRTENNLKSFAAQAKSEIAERDAKISLYSEKINTGKEYRPVECTIVYFWESKEKAWTRNDTHEVVKTDIIPESELQEEANL